MARKRRDEGQRSEGGGKGSKELKIISVQVVTRDSVVKSPRRMGLLYVIDRLGPMHERTLHGVVSRLQEKGADFGYEFKRIASSLYSRELREDLVALMYVGFVEAGAGKTRKLRVTSEGREALEKHGAPQGIVGVLQSGYEELRNETSLLDSHIDIQLRGRALQGRGGLAGSGTGKQ